MDSFEKCKLSAKLPLGYIYLCMCVCKFIMVRICLFSAILAIDLMIIYTIQL